MDLNVPLVTRHKIYIQRDSTLSPKSAVPYYDQSVNKGLNTGRPVS